ncbi:MAG: hypothetical protein ACRCUE_01950, partial [Bosea sp. (in: a-proteobacteria)]
ADLSQSDVDIVIVDDPFADLAQGRERDMPTNVLSALSMAEAVADADAMLDDLLFAEEAESLDRARQRHPEPDVELMAGDEEPILIDDLDTLEIDFVRIDEDVVEDKTAKVRPPQPRVDAAGLSLSHLDAMPATAKALIFG